MYAKTVTYMSLFLLFLFLSPADNALVGFSSSTKVAEATRLLRSESSQDYATMNPEESNSKQKVHFGGRVVENCLPKGVRHSSAPSHYANYHALGSTMCDCNGEPCKP
ncbi:hypothetical protein IFM89_007464 [Coptis chinensis]|uniref:Uncharacterized protein n=1 Tax=Coptis chinensis TaxID=261450 RepID=A0A835HA69_9MAGN|nr:hypothetical protein IFM89_007464 [Coptis chinensis]